MSVRITHGRHCTCGACMRQDWTNPDLAPCGMHGADCPTQYQPLGLAGYFPDGLQNVFVDLVREAEKIVTEASSWTPVASDATWAAVFTALVAQRRAVGQL